MLPARPVITRHMKVVSGFGVRTVPISLPALACLGELEAAAEQAAAAQVTAAQPKPARHVSWLQEITLAFWRQRQLKSPGG